LLAVFVFVSLFLVLCSRLLFIGATPKSSLSVVGSALP
jgi:hypothetical protein